MRLLPVLFAASYIQSNNVPLLTVLPSCLPKKKYLPKRVYFIHCWSTVGSRTLNCYQQPGLRGCKHWAYEVKEKQKKPQFESASNQSHLNWKVLAMKASSFHRISNQNKLLGPWETMGNYGKRLGWAARQARRNDHNSCPGIPIPNWWLWAALWICGHFFSNAFIKLLTFHRVHKALFKSVGDSSIQDIYILSSTGTKPGLGPLG